jgi:thiol-disulfide isomerase/thioredoxin
MRTLTAWLAAIVALGASACAKQKPLPIVEVGAPEIKALATAGRPTLVNVWATWCDPCRKEFPAMVKIARAHPNVRLVLVSADFPEQIAVARRFLAQQGITDTTYMKHGDDQSFINGLDPRWSGALPATFAYDAGGRRVTWWEGAASEAKFDSTVTLLETPSSGKGSTP